jgi:RNA polymerase sigma-70 factor (ECF subfamily)
MAGEVADIALMTDRVPRGDADDERRETFAALIVRAQSGDAVAFEQIMICTQHRVARVAWRMLGDKEDARDAAQEVFLRAFKYLRRFDPAQDFHGWLYRITINVCRAMARKKRRADHNRILSLDTEVMRGRPEAEVSRDDTESAAVIAQRRAIVARAIKRLPPKERAALVLRDLEGLSTEEVARVLNSSEATVRSQISTARVKLKVYCARLLRGGRQD